MLVRWVAVRARRAWRAAAASMLTVPGAIVMSVADPKRVAATRARAATSPSCWAFHDARYFPQSFSASRFTAAQSGFFILSQSREGPDRYGESFETMPSRPSLQA